MSIDFKHKMVNSFNADDIAVSRIHHFIKDFAKNTLMLGCYQLSIEKEKEKNAVNKSSYNKNNWENKSHLKRNKVQIYDFGFYIEKPESLDKKSPFLIKYSKYIKNIQGQVYYMNGNVLRIVIQCYSDKSMMLNLIQFHPESYKIVNRYFRLGKLSVKDMDTTKFEIRGFIECSFKFKSKNCFLDYIVTDIRFSNIVQVPTSKGSSTVLSDLLRAATGTRDRFYENFMIKFDNNQFQSLRSDELKKMQRSFPYFPELDKLILDDSFDDHIIVLEMEKI